MAEMVEAAPMRLAILHRYPRPLIRETNAAIEHLIANAQCENWTVDVLTFKRFDRLSGVRKFWKSLAWVVYAPLLVIGKRYDVIYCDDSYPFYPITVKLASPRSKLVLRIGDFHLMYYTRGLTYRILHAIEKIGWKLADRLIPISDVMAEKITSEVRVPLSVALDPVEIPDIVASESDGSVMFHGTLTRNKNIPALLGAALLLPHVRFVIAGDGPELTKLKNHAPGNVEFTCWLPQDDLARRISRCAVGVAIRSDNPGNQYVVTSPFLQYGAYGKPCLVSKRKVFGDYPWQFKDEFELTDMIERIREWPQEGGQLRAYVLEYHEARKIAGGIWRVLTSA